VDVVNLLRDVLAAGLQLDADGDRLNVRGPRSAAALVTALSVNKAGVLAAVRGGWPAVPEWVTVWAIEGAKPIEPFKVVVGEQGVTFLARAKGSPITHEWLTCARCGERQLLRSKVAGDRKCAMTPHCRGTMHREPRQREAAS
jgi:hypothetical protein